MDLISGSLRASRQFSSDLLLDSVLNSELFDVYNFDLYEDN